VYYFTQVSFERKFRRWQEKEIVQWEQQKNQEKRAALLQSRAVLGGKFTEQMAPFLSGFRYDPTEARFIGTPVDFVVFPGLAQGDPREIVIMEVKSTRSAGLTPQQRKIRQLIEDGMVRWELLQKSDDI
jgi:predicted Holliday junction resolvase-like endonuclease